MDRQTIARITSGVVGLGLVALGAWLTSQAEGEHASTLILAGLAVIGGGLGTSLLPSTLRERPSDPGAEERARRRAARRGPPPGPTMMLLALALTASGCGASVYRTHSTAIVTVASLHSVAYGVRDAARDAALDAVEAEHPEHGPARTEALTAEDARWRPSGAALDALRSALGVWVESLDAARLSDLPDVDLLALLAPVAARAVQLTQAVIEGLRALGVQGVPDVPPLVLSVARAAVGQ